MTQKKRALLAETTPHETFEGHPHDASCRECWPAPPQAREVDAAEAVARTYYEIAADAIGEDKVRAEFKRRFDRKLAALARLREVKP